MNIIESVDGYLNYLRLRDRAATTIIDRRNQAIRWSKYAPSGGSEDVFYEYIAQFTNPRYRISIWIGVKDFTRYLFKTGIIDRDWTGGVHVKVIQKEDYVILSPAEIRDIIGRIWRADPWLLQRDKTIMMLLYTTGCRASEIRLLKREDVDVAGDQIRVHLKGGRTVWQHLTPQAEEQLVRWMRLCHNPDCVFPSRQSHGRPMSTSAFRLAVMQAAELAGKPVTPHTFRRSAATNMLRGKAPLETVQKFLNHKSPATTLIYARLADDAAAVAADALLRIASFVGALLQTANIVIHATAHGGLT